MLACRRYGRTKDSLRRASWVRQVPVCNAAMTPVSRGVFCHGVPRRGNKVKGSSFYARPIRRRTQTVECFKEYAISTKFLQRFAKPYHINTARKSVALNQLNARESSLLSYFTRPEAPTAKGRKLRWEFRYHYIEPPVILFSSTPPPPPLLVLIFSRSSCELDYTGVREAGRFYTTSFRRIILCTRLRGWLWR